MKNSQTSHQQQQRHPLLERKEDDGKYNSVRFESYTTESVCWATLYVALCAFASMSVANVRSPSVSQSSGLMVLKHRSPSCAPDSKDAGFTSFVLFYPSLFVSSDCLFPPFSVFSHTLHVRKLAGTVFQMLYLACSN